MEFNVHSPERGEHETMLEYRDRQKQSRDRSHMGWYRNEVSNPIKNRARVSKRRVGARQYRIMRKEDARLYGVS